MTCNNFRLNSHTVNLIVVSDSFLISTHTDEDGERNNTNESFGRGAPMLCSETST